MDLENTEIHNVVRRSIQTLTSLLRVQKIGWVQSTVPKRALRKVGNQRTFETGGQRPCGNEGLQQYRHIDNG